MAMDAAEKIKAVIEPAVEASGFELVRVTFGGGGGRPTLQVMAERADGTMSVDDCAGLSRELSAVLDVENPVESEYVLEVSSPGIDRPLTRRKDFERWAGFEAKLELAAPVDGRKRFKGRLKGIEGETVVMALQEGDARLPLADVQRAKLVMSDELLEAAQQRARPS